MALPEKFWEWAESEWRDMKRVPITLGVAVFIGGLAVHIFYSERMAAMSEQIALVNAGGKAVETWNRWSVSMLAALGVACAGVMAMGVQNWRLRVSVRQQKDRAEASTIGMSHVETVAKERDAAVAALKAKKQEYAMDTLSRYSNIRFGDNVKPRVTVRHVSYDSDYEIAQQLKTLFTNTVGWTVTIDASNVPALDRAGRFKVVFDVGMTAITYGDLVHAFSEGELLGVPVGIKQFTDREDSDHLIIEVLPRES